MTQKKKYSVLGNADSTPILVKDTGKFGYITLEGKVQIPFRYDVALPFSEGLAAVCLNNVFHYINTKGDIVISTEYEDARPFSEGLAAVKKNGAWGYINLKGEVIIAFRYIDAGQFGLGMAPVSLHGKYFYINKGGDVLFGETYIHAESFISDPSSSVYATAWVMTATEYFAIDIKGEQIFDSNVAKEQFDAFKLEYRNKFYYPDREELYSIILNRDRPEADKETVRLIGEAAKHIGQISELGILLERASKKKLDRIQTQKYEIAAKYRAQEKDLQLKLMELLKETQKK